MTIKDIAKESGYAVGTVSRVLNDHKDVSPEAREKILKIVAQHDFTPNSNAKHLKQQESRGIAIVVKGTRNMLFAGILELLQSEIHRRGHSMFVTYLDEEDNEVLAAQRLCRERKPLGILFLGSNLTYFSESFPGISVPCVLITNSAKDLNFRNLASVSTDDVSAAAFCIDYLIKRGHRSIGILGGIACGSDASCARLEGCEQGFAAANLPFDPEKQYQIARFSMESGYAAMEKLLAAMPDMTAVFAFSDVMAIGALRALRDHGKRVPEDISVVGFDGIDLGQYAAPRLTTVKQDDVVIARRGVELLLSQIVRGSSAAYETIPFRLLEGESVQDLKKKKEMKAL
ncbi:MAG: LacI family transcriptional regulator [Oscillibacter sp.]|nr:LacI family transcriptional regulator [Oscillibacter sp.]